MQYSCRVPVSHSISATSELLEGNQCGSSCSSSQTALRSGSWKENWRLWGTFQDNWAPHRCAHPHWQWQSPLLPPCFSRQGLWPPLRSARTLTVYWGKQDVLYRPLLFHVCFSSFSLKIRVETLGPGTSLFNCSLKIKSERKRPLLDLGALYVSCAMDSH